MDTTPIADRLAKTRADLDKATTAAKLAAAKRARLAAEVRALEAEDMLEAVRAQARANRERAETAEARAEAAEATLARERAQHLVEEREHARELAAAEQGAPPKRAKGRTTNGTNGYTATAEPGRSTGPVATLAVVPTPEGAG